MQFLIDLWLPILLSAVFVFIASSVIHMALPIHKSDYKKLAGEEGVLAEMRKQNVQPGEYMFPSCASLKEMGSPEMIEKLNQGPVGVAIIIPNGPYAMGKSLMQWFAFSIVISIFAAYVASFALGAESDYGRVFRLTGTVATLGYAAGNVPNSIWKGQSWTTTSKFILDGVIYGLLTGGTFGWLWS